MTILSEIPPGASATPRRRPPLVVRRALCCVALALALPVSAATKPAEDIPLPAWQRLEMSATKLLLTARSTVEVEPAPAAEARTHWLDIDQPRESSETLVHLRSEASLLGRTSTNDVWIEADGLAAHQRTLVELGSRARTKTYRYGRSQVLAVRAEPADSGEGSLPPAEWTRRGRQSIPMGSGTVTDPLAIFYLVATAPEEELRAGIEVDVLSSNQIDTVRVQRRDGIELLETDASIRTSDGEILREGSATVPVILYAVAPTADGGDFSLLGLDGAIEIAIDHRYQVPLEIRGRISPVGRITVRLERALLRPEP